MSAESGPALLGLYGPALEAVAKGGIAALKSTSPRLLPLHLCECFAAGLGEVVAAPAAAPVAAPAASEETHGQVAETRSALLALARGAVDALNAASRSGSAEAMVFLSAALRAGLYKLVFRDKRAARAAAELDLTEATVAELESVAERAASTITRSAKPGEVVRTIFTKPDGTRLRSFVLFGPDDAPFLDSFVDSFEEQPIPAASLSFYADLRLSGTAAERAQLGERFIAAATSSFVASITVSTQNLALGSVSPTHIGRIFRIVSLVDLTPREFEGLFLTLGRHQIGVAVLMCLAVLTPAEGPAFKALLSPEIDGPARMLAVLADASLDEASVVGLLNVFAYGSSHSDDFARVLVEKGAFTALQVPIAGENVILAVRSAFAAASLAVAYKGSAELLRQSGVLDVIAHALSNIIIGGVIIPGFLTVVIPVAATLLQPGVEPALQLAALHRLAAGLTGTTANAALVVTAPLIASLRGCAMSPDTHISAAARYVLKELQQPVLAPARDSDTSATIKKLSHGENPNKVELYSLGLRLVASELALSDSGAAAASAASKKAAAAGAAGTGSGVEAATAEEQEEVTRSTLTGLLGRPSAPLDAAWRLFMTDKISEDQLLQTFASELAAGPAADSEAAPAAEPMPGLRLSFSESFGVGFRLPTIPGSPILQSEAATALPSLLAPPPLDLLQPTSVEDPSRSGQ